MSEEQIEDLIPAGTCRIARPDRGILAISGTDRVAFLQGLVSNDVAKATPARAVWAALLSPQGKYQYDFFIVAQGERLLLDCARDRLPDLHKRLRLFKLRSQVDLADLSDSFAVSVAFGAEALAEHGLPEEAGSAAKRGEALVFADPRDPRLGVRIVAPAEGADTRSAAADRQAYDRLRIALGLPEGAQDMQVEKSILLECGFDELGGVDWNKGCYMGQELTARTKYRGLVKRRLVPVTFEGGNVASGTAIAQAGKEVGEVRSVAAPYALATLRLDALQREEALTAGDALLTPLPRPWMAVPERAE